MVARVKTWTTSETLASSDLNTEFNNIVNAISSSTADHIDLADVYAWTGAHSWSAATTHTNTLTVGVDDAGHDVKFFGATSGQYMLWDQSSDELVLTGDSKLSFHDANGGENIIATSDGHLEVNAGTTLDITAPTVDLNSDTEFNIDTAAYDLNASGAVTIDSAGVSIDSSAASNLTTSGGALTITSAAAATWSTAAGALTLGSGAAINITPAAGSAIVLDGTINVDAGVVTGATSITSTAFVGDITGDVTGTATLATTVTITDNESTNETNAIIFTAGGDVDGGNLGLESDGDLTYNPSTGTVTATIFQGNIDAVDGDFDGTLEADAITLGGTALGSLYSPIAGSGSIVTTGALNSGSITSGFGTIDTGSSAITTTGVVTAATCEVTGDTSAGDNAAMGYTATEGLILTGQGSTNDVTIKNDADGNIMVCKTGGTVVDFPGKVGVGTAHTDGTLHVHTATAGSTTASGNFDDLVVENNTHVGISLLCPDGDEGAIVFGDATDPDRGRIRYDHDADAFIFMPAATEAMRIDSSQNLLVADGNGVVIGHSAQVATGATTGELQTHGTANADSRISFHRWSDDAGGVDLCLVKSRGALGTPGTIVQDNDTVGRILALVDDGNDLSEAVVQLQFEVDDGTPAENGTGGAFSVKTKTDAGASTEAMRIDSSQRVGIGGASAITGFHAEVIGSTGANLALRTTEASIIDGNNLGVLAFYGDDPSASFQGASILAEADGTWGTGDYPTRMLFRTDNSGTITEAMRIDSSQQVLMGTPGGTFPATGTALMVGGGTTADTLTFALDDTTSTQDQAIGIIDFWGNDAGDGDQVRARILADYRGTGGTAEIGFHVWDGDSLNEVMQIQDSDNVVIGTSIPVDGDGTLHVHTATAGSVTADNDANDLVVENSGDVGMTFLCPDDAEAWINFGDATDADRGYISYNHGSGTDTMKFATSSVLQLAIGNTGALYTGGETANANASRGSLTLNQGAADDEILAFKSSDVAHGATDFTETDTYGYFGKVNNDAGGLVMAGFRDTGASNDTAIYITGILAEQPVTTVSTTADGICSYFGKVSSGTSQTDISANGLVHTFGTRIGSSNRTIVVFDAEGDIHVDGSDTLTTFDHVPDALALRATRYGLLNGGAPLWMGAAPAEVRHYQDILEDAGVVTWNRVEDGGDGVPFLELKSATLMSWDGLFQAYLEREEIKGNVDVLNNRLETMQLQLNEANDKLARLEMN